VKGLGGFHLACDATDDAAVERLRARKGRVDKPFAIMVRDVETAERIAHLDDQERALLTGRERPIVLLRKRAGSSLSELVAPGNNFVGVMLPYTPLHYLLLDGTRIDADFSGENVPGTDPDNPVALKSPGPSPARSSDHAPCAALVMTSGNYSNEPIVKDNDEARRTLGKLADALLLHNRDIHARCDDSVIRVFQGRELPVRRSRGYAPFPVKLPFELRPTLAVGGELKATFCLTAGDHAFMSQHIGDMENLETLEAFSQAADHFEAIFRTRPEILACDRHPGYLSSRWARERVGDRPLIQVQHHHAHIAALMAEEGLDGEEPVIGFSFDGTGYGDDGAIWGGELLVADYRGYERLAHLAYVPLPGGDAAVKRPYRTALAHLAAAGVEWADDLPPVQACPPSERNVLARQIERGFNAVPTSSMGRLFDAVAALAGVRQQVTYEAQAAIELEALAGEPARTQTGGYRFALDRTREPWRFDAAPVIRAVVDDVQDDVPAAIIGDKFHNAVADLILDLSLAVRAERSLNQVALSGGVFQNVTLLRLAADRLNAAGFHVLVHRLVPPNDGGLALGQAVIANQLIDHG
jgi:hydrogenase maturation protein HypF